MQETRPPLCWTAVCSLHSRPWEMSSPPLPSAGVCLVWCPSGGGRGAAAIGQGTGAEAEWAARPASPQASRRGSAACPEPSSAPAQ